MIYDVIYYIYDMIYDMICFMIWYDMIWYDMIWLIRYDMIYDMIYLLDCNWIVTRWQQYSTHVHTNSTQNDTNKQYIEQHNFGRVRAVPRLWELYPGICLTTDEKARKYFSQGSRRVPAGAMKIRKHTITIHRHNTKNK